MNSGATVRLPDTMVFLSTLSSVGEQHPAIIEAAKMAIPTIGNSALITVKVSQSSTEDFACVAKWLKLQTWKRKVVNLSLSSAKRMFFFVIVKYFSSLYLNQVNFNVFIKVPYKLTTI